MKKQVLLGALLALCVLSVCLVTAVADTDPSQEKAGEAQELQAVLEEEPEEEPEEELVTMESLRMISFVDLPAGTPSYDAACYTTYYGILSSDENGQFDPYAPADRATVVAALYQLSGEEAPEERRQYTDVPQDSWYADAVAWANGAGIANGTTEQTFSPEVSVTRSQLAVILCRFAARRGDDMGRYVNLSAYSDGDQVPAYAEESLSWVTENGLYRVLARDELYPNMKVSRLQLAQILVELQALGGEDPLAAEICSSLPETMLVSDAQADHDVIQEAVDSISAKYGAAGVQVAVVESGEVSDTYAYGWATKNTDPMTADHKLRIASLSKVAVGLAVQALREEGTIDLDTGIGAYWDMEVINPYHKDTPVSIRTLLTHTSSIINAGDDVSRAYSSVRGKLQGSGFSRVLPGDIANWSYNNYAFGVLGMTLELASDRYVDEILDEKLFTSMGIDGSFVSGEVDDTAHLATLYRYDGSTARTVDTQKNLRLWDSPGASGTYFAGGLTISARDMGKLVALLAQDGRFEGVQLLEEESVALMETRSEQAVPGGSYQALPMRYFSDIYGREGLYYHTGSAYGVYNCMSYDPVTGDGVVVLTTGASGAKDDYGIYKVCAEISNHIYETIK